MAKASKVVAAGKKEKANDDGSVKGNRLDTLMALKSGKELTHDQIAKITGRDKGNLLRELTADGLVKTSQQEDVRGFVYSITAAGKKALQKSA